MGGGKRVGWGGVVTPTARTAATGAEFTGVAGPLEPLGPLESLGSSGVGAAGAECSVGQQEFLRASEHTWVRRPAVAWRQ